MFKCLVFNNLKYFYSCPNNQQLNHTIYLVSNKYKKIQTNGYVFSLSFDLCAKMRDEKDNYIAFDGFQRICPRKSG